jgi:endonuclease YncB( thermonuclease family)
MADRAKGFIRIGSTRIRLNGIDAPALAPKFRFSGGQWPCHQIPNWQIPVI